MTVCHDVMERRQLSFSLLIGLYDAVVQRTAYTRIKLVAIGKAPGYRHKTLYLVIVGRCLRAR
ncbi:hypothetical protein Geu3261_0118_004 [Komagataeibacter europaeus NBRC 3261]|uniref:Uncharacterized protein n=1 Tax=Komagataeibacter europaeus NBRC 3261 TaxID=1234669 RepID=A0A0D6Q275_KOMEU|nr:hypothetical protein Geu3261_0118_004 [Komagataeibacter europaeus NBRC 3261]